MTIIPALDLRDTQSSPEIPHVPANVEAGRLYLQAGTFRRRPAGYWFWMTPMRQSMREIASLVAERHGLTLEDLKSQSRRKQLARARQEAYALIYEAGGFSMPQIGRFFGNRDHTTVLHGIRKHKARQEAAPEARAA